jgi:hypothetical protein
MKRGVEHGDLPELRSPVQGRPDACKVRRVVERREVGARLDRGDRRGIEHDAVGERLAAVHDPMTHRRDRHRRELAERRVQRPFVAGAGQWARDGRHPGAGDDQPRAFAAQPLAEQLPGTGAGAGLQQRELDRGATAVDDEYVRIHGEARPAPARSTACSDASSRA